MFTHKVSYIAKLYSLFAFFSLIDISTTAQQLDDASLGNLTVENGTLVISGVKNVEGNLKISENASILFTDGARLVVGGDVCIMSDLILNNDSQISFGGNITLGGDVIIDASSGFNTTNAAYTIYFTGDRDVTFNDDSNMVLVNVVVDKQGESVVSMPEGRILRLTGNLTGKDGYLKGSVGFKSGNNQSYIEGYGDCLKNVDVRIDTHLKGSEPSLITTHPLSIKSLFSPTLEMFYIGKNELSISEGIKPGNLSRIVVDGFSADGGIIMPIKEGNKMNVCCYSDGVNLKDGKYMLEGTVRESSFTVDFSIPDNYVKFVLNNGNHFYTTTNERQKSDRSYFRVSTLKECIVEPSCATYTITPFNKSEEYRPAVYRDYDWLVEDNPQKTVVHFKGHTEGDFACLVIEDIECRKFVSTAKGTWDSKLWRMEGDESSLFKGSDITWFDDVTIKSGHSITSTPFSNANKFVHFKPVHINIEENGKLIIKHSDLMVDGVDMYATSIEGDGILEYHNSSVYNVNGTWTKYWDVSKFMKNEKTRYIYVNESKSVPVVTRFYTTPFIGNIEMSGKPFKVGDVNINTFQGDVTVKTDVEFTAGYVSLAKNLIVEEGYVLTVSGDCILEVKGSVNNKGTVICKDGATLRICGDVVNAGSMQVDGILSFSGGGNSRVSGNGFLSVNTVELKKLRRRFGAEIESLMNNASFNAELNCGFLHLKNANAEGISVNLNDTERGMLWLSVQKTNITASSIKGTLKIDGGGVTYMDNLKPRIEGIMDMPSVMITDNSKLVIRNRFDMRGGSLDMGEGAQLDILGNDIVRFSAVMGECNPTSCINIIGGNNVSIVTDTPWGNLHIGNNTNVEIMSSSLRVKGGLIVDEGAILNATEKNHGVCVSGDMLIDGDYLFGENETLLDGDCHVIKLVGGELYSLTCDGGRVQLTSSVVVKGNLSICNGASVSSHSLILSGNSLQRCKIDGEVEILEIDNAMGVNATGFQNGPMVVTDRLILTNGVFDIGTNILSLMPNATIEGSGKVKLLPSSTESGIRVHLNAEVERSVDMPITTDVGDMGVSVRDIVSSSTGSVTFSAEKGVWSLSSDDVQIKEGRMCCCIASSAASDISHCPLFKSKGNSWRKSDGEVRVDNGLLKVDFMLKGDLDGQYCIGDIPESSGVLVFETRRSIDRLSGFDSADWIVKDENGAEVDASYVHGFDGGVLKVNHDVHFDSELMSGMHLEAVEIAKGVVLDLDRSHNNVFNYISGKGTIRGCSSDAMPKGNYDLFFCEQEGCIDYAGSKDYDISPVVSRMGNVIISGSGKKRFVSSSVEIAGTLTVDGDGLVIKDGTNVYLNGDLIVRSGVIEGNGNLIMNGNGSQIVCADADEVSISGLIIDNSIGVSSKVNVCVDRLGLEKGVLNMDDKWIRVSECLDCSEDGPYISGVLIRNVKADELSLFPVGDRGMSGYMSICGQMDGLWQVKYHNESHPASTLFTSESYWEVLPLSQGSNSCSMTLSYDELGAFASHIVCLENTEWRRVNSTLKSGCKDRGYLASLPVNVRPVDGKPVAFALENRYREDICVWTGMVNSEWNNPMNWQDGVVPDIAMNVDIPHLSNGQYPVVSRYGAESRSIRIMENAGLSLRGSNASLRVKNNIVNMGSLDLYYMYTQIPQFIYGGGIVGNKPRIYRTFLRNRGYYIGSATEEGSFENLHCLNDDNGDVLRQFNTASHSFYDVNCLHGESMAEKAGSFLLNRACHSNDNYVVQYGTPVRDGALLTTPLSKGWHWLANPYPYTVNVKDYIKVIDGAINPTVYARGYKSENGIGGYLFYTYNLEENLTAAGNEYEKMETLAPFEGFAIYCEKDGTVLLLEQNIETTGSKQSKLKSDVVGGDNNVLRLSVGNGFRKDELVLVFKEGGSMTRHRSDSYKYASQPRSSFEIFTTKAQRKVAIALFPDIDKLPEDEVYFSVMPTDGDASSPVISVSGVDNIDNDYDVLLVDRLTGSNVNLRTTDRYEIQDVDNLYVDRFVLRFEYRDDLTPTKESVDAPPTNIPYTPSDVPTSSKMIRYGISGQRIDGHNRGVCIEKRVNSVRKMLYK